MLVHVERDLAHRQRRGAFNPGAPQQRLDAGEERAATVLHGAVDAAMGEVGIPFQSLEAGLRDALARIPMQGGFESLNVAGPSDARTMR